MTMWTYKIKTAVNSVVYYVPSIKAWFILQVSLVLLVNVVSYSLPTIQYKKKKNSYICLQFINGFKYKHTEQHSFINLGKAIPISNSYI